MLLRSYGPTIAQPKADGNLSFGYLAVAVLNKVLRPVLAYWHPRLLDHESLNTDSSERKKVSAFAHEHAWAEQEQLRKVLEETRQTLVEYANLLAEVAQVPSLTDDGT